MAENDLQERIFAVLFFLLRHGMIGLYPAADLYDERAIVRDISG